MMVSRPLPQLSRATHQPLRPSLLKKCLSWFLLKYLSCLAVTWRQKAGQLLEFIIV